MVALEWRIMDSFDSVLGALTRSEWVGDRITTLATIQPRHIGRIVTFDVYADPENLDDYDTSRTIGVLERAGGSGIYVAGTWFLWTEIANLKCYRREVVKK